MVGYVVLKWWGKLLFFLALFVYMNFCCLNQNLISNFKFSSGNSLHTHAYTYTLPPFTSFNISPLLLYWLTRFFYPFLILLTLPSQNNDRSDQTVINGAIRVSFSFGCKYNSKDYVSKSENGKSSIYIQYCMYVIYNYIYRVQCNLRSKTMKCLPPLLPLRWHLSSFWIIFIIFYV